MANETQKRKGVLRRYFSLIGVSAKGAVGAESIKQVGQFAGAAIDTVKHRACPRCMERSMLENHGHYVCTRTDICGFEAHGEVAVENMREAMHAVNPQVLAVAKGFTGDFGKRAQGAKKVSWLLWGVTALILAYSFSWLIEMNWLYVGWTALVAVYTAVNAIRYAYMSYRLGGVVNVKPRQFLVRPSLWFVG